MFKRIFWLVVGAGFGFGMAFLVMRQVKAAAQRYTPERVSGDLAAGLRSFGSDLRAAVAEGRAGMREFEEGLRADIEGRAPRTDPLAGRLGPRPDGTAAADGSDPGDQAGPKAPGRGSERRRGR